MNGRRPDRSFAVLAMAALFTLLGVPKALGHHPDYTLLGAAAPLWAAWATMDREVKRKRARARRRRRPPAKKPADDKDGGGPGK